MKTLWQPLQDELARWRDAGQVADFWWRDDDATTRTPALERLLALSRDASVPLALAVIPMGVQTGLLADQDRGVTLLQHGVVHHNLAPTGEKKTEFPVSEPVPAALDRLAQGRMRLTALFGDRALPVLVPPWNRISAPDLLPALTGGGFRGLSRFGPRTLRGMPEGLVQVNTHVDVIDWKGTRGFVGTEVALAQVLAHLQARRHARVDAAEATGCLTHHAVHDEATWMFLEELFAQTAGRGLVVWRSASELFP
jgi:hypothetical protein